MANQELTFDITKKTSLQPAQQTIYGRVGDGGLKAVTIKVLSDGSDYDLSGKWVRFMGMKADGTRIIDTNGGTVLEPQNGIFRFVFDKQAFSAKGTYIQAFFQIMQGDNVDSTLDINIEVWGNKVELGINSKEYITDYERLVNQLTDLFNKNIEKINQQTDATVKQQQALTTQMDTLEDRLNHADVIGKDEFAQAMDNVVHYDKFSKRTD